MSCSDVEARERWTVAEPEGSFRSVPFFRCLAIKTVIYLGVLALAALGFPAFAEDEATPEPLQMEVAEVYDFSVSLMELRERTQHRRFDGDELKVIADALASARFLKKMEHADVARTPNISRYQFRHGFLGGTPRTGETESGMLTIDCRTLYWDESIFALDEANAAKLKKLFPKPVNPRTKSERPTIEVDDDQPGQSARPATAPESKLKASRDLAPFRG